MNSSGRNGPLAVQRGAKPQGGAGSAGALAARLESAGVVPGETFASVPEALAAARAQAKDDDRIVVFGSFLTVAEALRALHVQDTEAR